MPSDQIRISRLLLHHRIEHRWSIWTSLQFDKQILMFSILKYISSFLKIKKFFGDFGMCRRRSYETWMMDIISKKIFRNPNKKCFFNIYECSRIFLKIECMFFLHFLWNIEIFADIGSICYFFKNLRNLLFFCFSTCFLVFAFWRQQRFKRSN